MTRGNNTLFGDDSFPTEERDQHAIEEISSTLAARLPSNAVHYLLQHTNKVTQAQIYKILEGLTIPDVERIIAEEGIVHLLTFIEEEVRKLLYVHPEITTIEQRYELCSNALTQDKNPLLPHIQKHLGKN